MDNIPGYRHAWKPCFWCGGTGYLLRAKDHLRLTCNECKGIGTNGYHEKIPEYWAKKDVPEPQDRSSP